MLAGCGSGNSLPLAKYSLLSRKNSLPSNFNFPAVRPAAELSDGFQPPSALRRRRGHTRPAPRLLRRYGALLPQAFRGLTILYH